MTEQADGRAVSLVIVDDEEVTRGGLRLLLSAQPGIEVLGEAEDGSEVVDLVRRLRPDVVLMDVRMPHVNGIDATRLLLSELSEPPKVVVITTFENDDHVYAALQVGASGFVLKRAPAKQIAQAVRLVAAGDALLFPEALRRLVTAMPPVTSASATASAAAAGGADVGTGPGSGGRGLPAINTLNTLTEREGHVLHLMAAGLSNPDIAARLVVSLETVKTHVGNILTKLHAQNRTHAVVMAYECGFVVPGAGRYTPTAQSGTVRR